MLIGIFNASCSFRSLFIRGYAASPVTIAIMQSCIPMRDPLRVSRISNEMVVNIKALFLCVFLTHLIVSAVNTVIIDRFCHLSLIDFILYKFGMCT